MVGKRISQASQRKKKAEQIGVCVCMHVSTHMHITMGREDIRKKQGFWWSNNKKYIGG